MKTRLWPLIVIMAFAACNNNAPQPAENKPAAPAPQQHKPVLLPRNTTVTRDNSYSDLFLDSTAVEHFIARQHMGGDTAAALRSFYNARNFEYAWFHSKGLTEQALAFRTLYDYTKDSSARRKLLDDDLDELMAKDSLSIDEPDAAIIKTELLLSWRFINYILAGYDNDDRRNIALQQMVPA
ncbi:MAG: hypothetical protein JST39_00500, partial [Bacteroidetes bacterium]|nr:hypothetical protein [Bacteroidota bacterium]